MFWRITLHQKVMTVLIQMSMVKFVQIDQKSRGNSDSLFRNWSMDQVNKITADHSWLGTIKSCSRIYENWQQKSWKFVNLLYIFLFKNLYPRIWTLDLREISMNVLPWEKVSKYMCNIWDETANCNMRSRSKNGRLFC